VPPKSGGYWIDPPLDRHVETSPTLSQGGFGLESYDIMERDSEAKVFQEFFRHRVSDHVFFSFFFSFGNLINSTYSLNVFIICIPFFQLCYSIIIRSLPVTPYLGP